DDVMHRARLGAQIAALSAPGLAAVGSHVRLFPRRTLRDGWRAYEQWLNGIDSAQQVRDEAYIECPVVHPTLMIRRDVLAALRYRDCGWPEDYDLVLRLLGAGHEVGVVPRRLLAWRDSAARLSRTSSTYALDRLTARKAAFPADQFLSGEFSITERGLGGWGRRRRTLGLVLSGGGARGAFHVGVYGRLLADPRFAAGPAVLSGTSAGAINAALIAAGKTPAEMMQFWQRIADDPPVAASDVFFRDVARRLVRLGFEEAVRWFSTTQAVRTF